MLAWLRQFCVWQHLVILLLGGATGINLCGTANAGISGNFLLLYDLIKEDDEWSREVEERLNLNLGGNDGLERLLKLNLGIIRRGKEWDLLGGLIPTYALNLKGKYYSLSSGYSVRLYRDITGSRLYEDLSLFPSGLPVFRLSYSRQRMRDNLEEHRLNSTGSNMRLSVEDEIGPFSIRLSKREYTSRNLARGPEYIVESSDTSGNVDFAHSYGRLLSLNGQYGRGQLKADRVLTGEETETETHDFSLGFRISPVPTIALSGTTAGRWQQRSSSGTQESLPANDSLTNRLQLMLQPMAGILLNAAYSRSDTAQNEGGSLINNTRSVRVNLNPWQSLTFSGNLMIYDYEERERRLSTLRRSSSGMQIEFIDGLQFSSRLDQSKSTNFVTGLRSDRRNTTGRLEAVLTQNFTTDVSYDRLKSSRESEGAIDEEIRHRMTLAGRYSFARMLDLNFTYSREMSSMWEGSTTISNCGLSYSEDKSHVSVRYGRVSSPGRSSLLSAGRWATQSLAIDFDQEVGQNTNLTFSYDSRSSREQLGYTGYGGGKRFSFRMNIRF